MISRSMTVEPCGDRGERKAPFTKVYVLRHREGSTYAIAIVHAVTEEADEDWPRIEFVSDRPLREEPDGWGAFRAALVEAWDLAMKLRAEASGGDGEARALLRRAVGYVHEVDRLRDEAREILDAFAKLK